MKRIFRDDFYHQSYEGNKIISYKGMIIIILINGFLLYMGIVVWPGKFFSLPEKMLLSCLTTILMAVQAIFSAINWNKLHYQIVAKVALLGVILDFVLLPASLIGLI